MFSIFGDEGIVGMNKRTLRNTSFFDTSFLLNSLALNQNYFGSLKSFLLVFAVLFVHFVSSAQCLKSGSTCNIAAIRTALTNAGCVELGCGSDSCSIYFFNPATLTADSAERFAVNLGGHLASIQSASQNDSIVKWLTVPGHSGAVWLGFNDVTTEGKFLWTDGSDTTYKNWAIGKPNAATANDDYVNLWISGADSSKWNDTIGSISLKSVIKISLCMDLTMSPKDTICKNDSSSLYVSPRFGSTPYSFLWSTTSIADTVKVSPALTSTYKVTVTDRYACTATDSIELKIDTLPTFSMGGTDTICGDTFLILDAGAGYKYKWHTGIPSDTNRTFRADVTNTYWCKRTNKNGCSFTDTFKLQVDTLPTFTLGDDTTVCSGDTATIISPLSSANYQLKWQDNSTLSYYKADTTEHLKLTVTDLNGCSFTDSMYVTWHAKQHIKLQGDTTVCTGVNFVVNALTGFLYHRWIIYTDTIKTAYIAIDTNGTYFYHGVDLNNCPMTDTFSVSYDTIPVINLGNDTSICQYDTLYLDAGPRYQSYFWPHNGGTTRTSKGYNEQGYNVIVSDSNGCEGSASLMLGIDTLPVVGLKRNGLAGDTSICTLDSIVLHARVDSSQEYSWNNGPFLKYDDSLVVKTAGLFKLTIRDTNTCINKDSLRVSLDSLPVVNLGIDTTICKNDSILLKTNYSKHYRYTWNNVSKGNIDSMWAKKDTSYWVRVIDTNTTCKNIDTMKLSHDTLPIINLGVDTAFCVGDSIIVDAGANYKTYTWNTLDSTQKITVKKAGTYAVNVTDKNGCKGFDSKIIQKNILPNPNLGPDKEFCAGTAVNEVLDPGAGYIFYNWAGGPAGDSTAARKKTVTLQGTYRVTVTDKNKCKASDTIHINANFLPKVNLGPDTSFCSGDKFNFIVNAGPGFVQYEWFESKFGGPLIPLISTGQILLIQDTSSRVIVRITDIKGCQNLDTLSVVELIPPIVNFVTSRYCEVTAPVFSETVDADPTLSYNFFKWSTGDTSRSITATKAGDYIVTVTANNGCETVATKSIIEVPQPIIDFSGDTLLCKGTAVKLKAFNEGYTHYSWYKVSKIAGISDSLINPKVAGDTIPDTTASDITVYQPGIYKLVTRYFQDPFCIDSNQTEIREDIRPTIDFGIESPDTTLCVGETLKLSPHFSGSSSEKVNYLWQNGLSDTVMLARSTGLYTLTLTNDCGSEIDEVYVLFDDCSNIWIPNSFTPNGDGDNDLWGVTSLESFLEYKLTVFDNMGGVAWESNLPGVLWDGTHQVSAKPMPTGSYIYKLSYRSNYELINDVNSAPTKEVFGQLHLYR